MMKHLRNVRSFKDLQNEISMDTNSQVEVTEEMKKLAMLPEHSKLR